MSEDDMKTPRRIDVNRWVEAEIVIQDAVDIIENTMPADEDLTAAVILLSQARGKVADFVDRLPPRA